MKRIFILMLVCMAALQGYSNTGLTGKWVYANVAGSDKLDKQAREMMNTMFGGSFFLFKENGHYKVRMMGKTEEGEWSHAGGKVVLTGNNGEITELEVVALAEKELTVAVKKMKIIMAKEPATDEDLEETPVPVITTVSAKKKQVCKKWVLTSTFNETKDEDGNAFLTDLTKGAVLILNDDMSFFQDVLGIDVEGTWEFGRDNTCIITTDTENGSRKLWNIVAISKNELTLTKGYTTQKLIYTAE